MLKNIQNVFMHLHLQAKVYLGLVIISLFMNYLYMSWNSILFLIIFALAWAYLIEYVGKKGMRSSAWVLAILPFAIAYFKKSASMNHMIYQLTSGMSSTASAAKKGAASATGSQ
jgi:hypothetical protein